MGLETKCFHVFSIKAKISYLSTIFNCDINLKLKTSISRRVMPFDGLTDEMSQPQRNNGVTLLGWRR